MAENEIWKLGILSEMGGFQKLAGVEINMQMYHVRITTPQFSWLCYQTVNWTHNSPVVSLPIFENDLISESASLPPPTSLKKTHHNYHRLARKWKWLVEWRLNFKHIMQRGGKFAPSCRYVLTQLLSFDEPPEFFISFLLWTKHKRDSSSQISYSWSKIVKTT